MTKNWHEAESGLDERAIESTPLTCFFALNSAFSRRGPSPMPLPCGQPPWIMKPGITR